MTARALKTIFNSFFVIINLLVIVLFVMAAFSDRIAPDQNLFFSYLGLGFPILFFLNICFLLWWILIGEWRFIFISLVSFVVCWNPLSGYFPFHGRVKDIPEENTLKVLTYNVMGFAYKDHTKDVPNEIVRYIAESGADIVCLQEYVVHTSDKFLTAKKLNAALSMYPYRSVINLKSSSSQIWGLAVYSKYPISKSKRIPYESISNGSSIHEINFKGKKITLINNHLESFKLTMEDKNRCSEFIKNVGSETFDNLKGAIQQKLGPAFVKRAEQARLIAEEIDKTTNAYVLVCGDFNDTPISYTHHTIQGPLLDAFSESGRGFGITYNENFFWFRIDHILYSPNMRSLNCTVDKVKYSDHYPVWCYLEIE